MRKGHFVFTGHLFCTNVKSSTSLKHPFPTFFNLSGAGPEELCQFRRVLTSQLMFGVVERHLWLSLWERPTHSCFTRGQRVTCCALMLHLYLALGALWYGAVGSEENR